MNPRYTLEHKDKLLVMKKMIYSQKPCLKGIDISAWGQEDRSTASADATPGRQAPRIHTLKVLYKRDRRRNCTPARRTRVVQWKGFLSPGERSWWPWCSFIPVSPGQNDRKQEWSSFYVIPSGYRILGYCLLGWRRTSLRSLRLTPGWFI